LAKLLNSTLEEPAPYRLALFIGAGLLIPTVLALLATDDTEATPVAPATAQMESSSERAGTLPIGLISFMALVVFLVVAGNSAARTFFNLYLDDGLHLSTASIGVLAAIGNLLGGAIALLTPLAIARWGKANTI